MFTRRVCVVLSVLATLAVAAGCGEARPIAARGEGHKCARCHGFPPLGVGPHAEDMVTCSGCHEGTHLDGNLDVATGCTSCHGGVDNQTGAPPAAVIGNTVGEAVIGAHTAHVNALVACTVCHGATAAGAPGHADGGRAEIAFTGLALADGATPSYTPETFTCSGVYCHGGTLAGGAQPSPAWTGSGAGCATCHGFPPVDVPPHAEGMTACSGCHEGTHLDGNLDVDFRCTSCHGGVDNDTGAPPAPVVGSPAGPSAVGAHTRHVNALVGCSVCHGATVPGTPGHADGGRAEIAFTGLARADGATPSYDEATFRCSGVYCHGGTLAGGTQSSPVWTGPAVGCTSCHGFPPVPPHSGSETGCAACHTGPSAPTHVNGTVDIVSPHAEGYATPAVHGAEYLDHVAGAPGTLDCRSCHGAELTRCDACHSASGSWVGWESNCTFCHGSRMASYGADLLPFASPGSAGDTVRMRLESTTAVTTADTYRIGKHRSHVLQETGSSDPYPVVPCAACHVVPTTVDHVSAGPDRRASVGFDTREAFPGLTEAQYAALPGPLATYTPYATNASGTIYQCSTYCHGSDPQTGAALWGGAETRPQWRSSYANVTCASCHANPPPTGKLVELCDRDGDGVPEPCSVHEWHDLVAEGGCGACHPAATGATHVSGVKDVTSIGWDAAAKSCTNVSCHGSPDAMRTWYE